MKLLLDTHVWIWSHLAPERLSKKAAAAMRSTRHELWLSPVSIWELLLLAESGRIRVRGSAREWIEQALRNKPMQEAGLNHAVAIASRDVSIEHQDPADRFIAATAAVYDLTLVTADERLRAGSGYRTLAG